MSLLDLFNISALQHGGFVALGLLIYFVVTRATRQRRHPSAALAWVMSLALLPYLAIPAFLMFGTRKVERPAPARRLALPQDPDTPRWLAPLLAGMGIAPASANQRVTFDADGAQALATLTGLIEQARHELVLGTYVLGHHGVGLQIAQALMGAAQRGVSVRLLIDAVGSWRAPPTLLWRLSASGVQVRRFMPLLLNSVRGHTNLRNHRKLVVADGHRLWAGGRNLASEYFVDQVGEPAWTDLSFTLEGAIAGEALAAFERDWRKSSDDWLSGRTRAPAGAPPAPAGPRAVGATPPPAPDGHTHVAQWIPSGPDRFEDSLHALLMAGVYQARHRVLAMSPYFVPDDALLNALCTASRSGVQVCLVLPARSNHRLADLARHRALRALAEAGATIVLTDAMVHAKVLMFDDDVALCGSANLDGRSLFLNYEAMTAFYSAADIAWIDKWFDARARAGHAYQPRPPNWFQDLAEGLVRVVGFQL
ncbi:MAG: phospholipase D-like domain-containing protein [Burkholderiaceae bacterium]